MEKFDSGIVGGGLAGLSLSILLARQGKRVVLWEKSGFPFHRVCGEYLSLESLPFLKRLMPAFAWDELPRIHQLLISSPTGKILKEHLPLGGFGISRFLLDRLLAEEAVKSGTLLLEHTPVKQFTESKAGFEVQAAQQTWLCTNLFLSHGKGRGPGEDARGLKKGRNFIGVKYHIRFPHPPDEIQLHNFRNGYAGMSRVEEGISCFCYLADAAELQAFGNDIRSLEEKLLKRNPHLKTILENAEFLWDSPKVISGIRFGEWGSQRNNAILLGDAAGCIAPLCGNGMSLALHAAKVLGEDLIDSPNPGFEYANFRKKHFSSRIRAGSRIQEFFGSEFLGHAALGLISAMPATFRRKIIRLTHGKPF